MARGRAKLAVSTGISVWLLDAPDGFGDARFHAHHAIQITICFNGSVSLIEHDRVVTGPLLAVAPEHSHRLEASGLLGIVFVEPESPIGRHLRGIWFGAARLVAIDDRRFLDAIAPLQRAMDEGYDDHTMLRIAHEALGAIAPADPPAPRDERVQRIVDCAMTRPGASLQQVAEAAGIYLSESRLRHLFVAHTGLAFKTYMLWQRLVRAVGFYAEGLTLTQAALEAGFADSAHFSRAFKATFGAPASTLTRL